MIKMVRVYICPHPDCDDYYGATGTRLEGMPNFESSMKHDTTSDPANPRITSHRIDCPTCRAVGRGVITRVPHDLAVQVEELPTVVNN